MLYYNYPLKTLNTFGFDVKAAFFAAPQKINELRSLLARRDKTLPLLILGGGSNVLFCGNFSGIVVQPQISSIEKIKEDSNFVYLRVGAGVAWDDFVAHSIACGWGGAENLSYIPGNVGASPIQNIGAYGVEVKDIIHEVECLYMENGESRVFSNTECQFGYRNSIFKHEHKNKMIVTHVIFRLLKNPILNTQYGNVADELKKYDKISIHTLREAIITIRRRKLPDPAVVGNAGSFFKNPVVSKKMAEAIISKYPQIVTYPTDDNQIKLSAAQLIEQAGWKGWRTGNVGVHTQQALVLVNYGGGTGEDIMKLAYSITQSVKNKFGIRLEHEVNIVSPTLNLTII